MNPPTSSKNPPPQARWHLLTAEEATARLGSDPRSGLSRDEAARRLDAHGPNELVEKGVKSAWHILWEQLTAVLVLVLVGACVVSFFLGEIQDALAILVIVLLNAALGVRQEYKAERALAALKKLAVPTVRVVRGGHDLEVSARELVPGDLVLFEAGGFVPADARLVEAAALRVSESALTGESEPVEKTAASLAVDPEGDTPLGDRRNMAYMGTMATFGRGRAVVTATGMATELGKVAGMLQRVVSEPTPLQRRLDAVGKRLAIAAFFLVGAIFAMGIARGGSAREMFLTAVSLAVAAIPEGLPAVVTIALALGAQRMLRRRALIRRLPAVETLGSVTVICSDKTGTLTENRMTVTVLDAAGHRVEMTEHLRRRPPEVDAPHDSGILSPDVGLDLILAGGALCSDARLAHGPDGGPAAVGDPTEGALVVAAARRGLLQDALASFMPRVGEVPFDSVRKRMTTIHRIPADLAALPQGLFQAARWVSELGGEDRLVVTKGAVDSLLAVCSGVWAEGHREALTPVWRERIEKANADLAGKGMRVLGVAIGRTSSAGDVGEQTERGLIFVGMAGLMDPPRPEVREAVDICRRAGIRPVMITGDHPLTALAVAEELGLGGGRVLTGRELDQLGPEGIAREVETVSVYARVAPEHKLSIVAALQAKGHVVAMTGDGVNDAPALKKADIGVAMGITGTDVSKEAADMVLLDDNFATIVAAVREGRAIFDNIRKFIKYILASNTGEILVMFAAPFLGMPLPLLPLQLLWINLLTDGLPAVALGVEPAERGVMDRPPFRTEESVFSRGIGPHILWVGALMGAVCLALGFVYWEAGSAAWQTVVFTTLCFCQMFHVLAVRPGWESLFSVGLLSNRAMLGAVSLTVALQIIVLYVPPAAALFKVVPLTFGQLAACVAASSVIFWAVEAEKVLCRKGVLYKKQT